MSRSEAPWGVRPMLVVLAMLAAILSTSYLAQPSVVQPKVAVAQPEPARPAVDLSVSRKAPRYKLVANKAEKALSAKVTPFKQTVRVSVSVRNVRTIATTESNKPLKQLNKGAQVAVKGTVTGQDPYGTGERTWYQLSDGTYVWASDLQVVSRPKPVSKPKPQMKPRPQTRDSSAYVKPIRGAEFSSDYGPRKAPKLENGGYGSSFHRGIDLSAPKGTPIYAVTTGKVIHSGWYGGAGLCVMIRHADGTVTLYAHTSRTFVRVGQRVPTGYKIAAVGSTGNSSGPHLHFGVKVGGQFINPEPWLARRGIYMR